MKKNKTELEVETFQPAKGIKHKHFQTMFPSLFRKPLELDIEVERFELDDGDFVECFWHHTTTPSTQNPIVVLFHGLTGSFESPYIKGMMCALNKSGFSSVLMHFRGCSGEMNRLPRSYHSGDTADAKAWIETLQKRYPKRPLFAVGYSLGGNMLLKLLGEWGNSSPLCAAVSVSAPLQLDICSTQMNQGFAKLYQYVLLKDLKQHLLNKYKKYDMKAIIGIEEQEVRQLNTFWDFDDVYTGPIHGFKSAADYYQQCSSKQFLKDITTKTLIIHALDDPFMPSDVLPDEDSIPPNVQLEVHPTGGHLGFVSNHLFKPQYWLESRIIHFFNTFKSNKK